MTALKRMDPTTSHQTLTDHPHYKYRGCAPDPDDPQLAVGSVRRDGVTVRVPFTAWESPDVDGGEDPEAREARQDAAREVCVECPVMVQCLAYGSSLTPSGKLAEPHAILGGMTALERHKALVAFLEERQAQKAKEPAPDRHLRTEQKLAVLRALAVYADEYRVAIETGLDVRKANWQRARLVSGLALDPSASRMELLAAAVGRGLLDGGLVVADDGSVPAIPAATRKLLIEYQGQFLLWPSDPSEVKEAAPVRRVSGRTGPRPARSVSLRKKFRRVEGQEAFDVDAVRADAWAYVHDLFSSAPVLEAAA